MPVCISVRRMLGPLKVAASSTRSVVCSSTSASTLPNTPAMTRGRSTSAMTSISPSSVRSTPSRVTIFSPSAARRTISLSPRILAGVEGVQRLAPAEHHVVGHVDDVVDGPHAGVRETRLEPGRRLAHLDAADDPRRVARAQVGVRDLDGDGLGRRGAAEDGGLGDGRRRQLDAGRRRDLTGDAVDAEAVGPVGGELQLEHGLADRQVVLQGLAHDPVRGQHDDAGALLLEAELLLAHHHAVALDAAQVGLLELEPVLEDGAAERDGDDVARLEVGRRRRRSA